MAFEKGFQRDGDKTALRDRPSVRTWWSVLVCVLVAPSLLVIALGVAALGGFFSSFGCADPREDCRVSDSVSGDHTLPDVLRRFSVEPPCGTSGVRYAYADVSNSPDEFFALHATVTPGCLRAFVAQVVPGADLDAAPLARPGTEGYPFRLEHGSFPNGALVQPNPGHAYRIVTPAKAVGGREVYLAIDTDTPVPTVEARFVWAAPDAWPR